MKKFLLSTMLVLISAIGIQAQILENIQAPVFSASSGVYTEAVKVKLTSETTSLTGVTKARFYYTTNGDEPTTSSAQAYNGIVPDIKTSCTVKAILWIIYNGTEYVSEVSSQTYIISEKVPFKKAATITEGSYLLVADSKVATPMQERNTSLAAADVEINGDYIETATYYAFTFTAAESGYYITDVNNNYLYASENGEIHTVSESSPEYLWKVEYNTDNTVKLTQKSQVIIYNEGIFTLCSTIAVPGTAIYPTIYLEGKYPTLEITPNPSEGSVEALQHFMVYCNDGINFDEEAGIVTLIDPTSGEWNDNIGDYVYSRYYELTTTSIGDKQIILSTDEVIEEPGEYQLTIPDGFFILDPDGLAIKSEAYGLYYTIEVADKVDFKIATVTPAEGLITSLSRIEITFTAYCGDSYKTLDIVDANGNIVATATPTYQDENGDWYDYNKMAYVLDNVITAEGVYTMEIHETAIPSSEYDENWNPIYLEATKLKWAIGETNMTGITDVETENNEGTIIYDLTGRRIKNITNKGIYIINGKKTFIK